MKTILRFFTFSCALILIAGCDKEENLVNNDQTHLLKAGNAGIIESVTGSGHFMRSDYFEPEVWRTFTVNAVKKADGTVSGHFELNNHNLTKLAGMVLCLSIDGNLAKIVCKWERFDTSVSDPVSEYGYILLEDNGEGQAGMPDKISLWQYISNPEIYCSTWIPSDLIPIEAGNIQIH